MMEMAETASITTPSLKRSSLSEASTISDVSNSSAGSRERLIAGVSDIIVLIIMWRLSFFTFVCFVVTSQCITGSMQAHITCCPRCNCCRLLYYVQQRPQSSGLLVSQKAPKRRVRAKEEEESADTFVSEMLPLSLCSVRIIMTLIVHFYSLQDPSKVDDYFTDIQEGVVNIANTIERVSFMLTATELFSLHAHA